MRLRKGSFTRPCTVCAVEVTNKEQICGLCGYETARRRHSRHRARTFQIEFARLTAIETENTGVGGESSRDWRDR